MKNLVRCARWFTLYNNGSKASSFNSSTTSALNFTEVVNKVYVGFPGSTKFYGNVDEFRLSVGVARYTSAFTPSTEPFSVTGVVYPSPSTAGQVLYDASNLYVCTVGGSPGTWRRFALS